MDVTNLFALLKYANIRQPGGEPRPVVGPGKILTKQDLMPRTKRQIEESIGAEASRTGNETQANNSYNINIGTRTETEAM